MERYQVDEHNPMRAKFFVPCISNRCPGRMQLRIRYADGSLLPRPYYLCERNTGLAPCVHSETPVYADELRASWVVSAHRGQHYKKSGRTEETELTPEQMETML